MASTPAQVDVDTLLDRWVEQGLLTADQAARIREAEGAAVAPAAGPEPEPEPHRVSLLAEALGYTGGALVLVAVSLLIGRSWEQLGAGGQCGLLGGLALGLVVAGAAVPSRAPEGRRLRAVLWAISVGLTSGMLAILASQFLDLHETSVALVAAGGASVLAIALWRWHRTALQQAVTLAALASAVAALVQKWDVAGPGVVGAALWVLGAAWYLLGRRGLLPPPRVATVLGPVTVVVGCAALSSNGVGRFAVLATLALMLTLAVLRHDLWLLGVGAVGCVILVPSVVSQWFPGRLAAAAALLVVGIVLLAAAVGTTTRRQH